MLVDVDSGYMEKYIWHDCEVRRNVPKLKYSGTVESKILVESKQMTKDLKVIKELQNG